MAEEATSSFHEANPLRPGIPKPSLAEHLAVELTLLEALTDRTPSLVDDGPTVRSTGFAGDLDDESRTAWVAVQHTLRDSGWGVPRQTELGLDSEVVHALLRDGSLVAVDGTFAYLPEQLQELVRLVRSMDDGFSVADFRNTLDITRKHAVPLLEWLDRSGITRRKGDLRLIRPLPPGGPGPDGAPSR